MQRFIATRIVAGSMISVLMFATHGSLRAEPADDTETTPEPLLLWPAGAPEAKGDQEHDKPSITPYVLKDADAMAGAVIVCPGGGYGNLAMSYEGHDVAKWFNTIGLHAFVLRYRHSPHYRHPAPLNDVQRAIRTVRANAAKWRIDAERVGVLGFSAGGHLASTAGTHFDAGDSSSSDAIARESCRPDFLVLVYPVISFTTEFTHRGSRRNLLGDSPDDALVASLSNEMQVTEATPPAFLFHTSDDQAVSAENSVLFYLALRKAGVPVEMHIFEPGRHGVGLATDHAALSVWPELCRNWLTTRGVLP